MTDPKTIADAPPPCVPLGSEDPPDSDAASLAVDQGAFLSARQAARFADRHTPIPYCGCWVWTHRVSKKGYGLFKVHGRRQFAHRISYEHHVGPIPPGLLVLHSCDVPACVNPDHLRTGTHQDNVRDRRARGTGFKITRHQAADIIAAAGTGTPHAAIAKRYGISVGHVGKIARGARWGQLR